MRSRVFGGTKYLSFAIIPYDLLIFTAIFSKRYFQLILQSIRTGQNPSSGTSLSSEFKSTQTCMCIKNVRKKGIRLWTLQRMFQPWKEYGWRKYGCPNKNTRNSTQCILKYTFKIIYMYITFPKVPPPRYFPFTHILRSLLTKRKKTWVTIFRLVDTSHSFL